MEKETKKKKSGVLDLLFSQIENFKDCDKFKEMLDYCANFNHIAPYNAMLLQAQMPEARYVLNANQWRKKFNRVPKSNARLLITLIPFGPVDFMYEVSDTIAVKESIEEGQSTQEIYYTRKNGQSVLCSEMTDEDIIEAFEQEKNKNKFIITPNLFATICNNLAADGILYHTTKMYGGNTGKISSVIEPCSYPIYYEFVKDILVPSYSRFELIGDCEATLEKQYVAICHELGHLFCHHICNTGKPWWEKTDHAENAEEIEEFEAETVAWLVCSRMGIKTDSVQYLAEYYQKNKQIPPICVDRVMKAAAEVEKRVQGYMAPQEGLLYKNVRSFRLIIDSEKKKLQERYGKNYKQIIRKKMR